MNPRNKYLAVILLMAISLPSMGQVARVQNHPGYDFKWIHFGFMVGLNTMNASFDRPSAGTDSSYFFADIARPNPGFQVSIVSDLRLNDHFTLRFLPGITFGSREFSYYEGDGAGNTALNARWTIESNFLDFPLLVKYKSKRVNNYRPYMIGGLSFRYDMAARREYEEGGPYIRLKKSDFYMEIGFGVDMFLQYFKFAPELKLSLGFRDVLVHEPAGGDNSLYVNSIESINSYVVMLCFYFE